MITAGPIELPSWTETNAIPVAIAIESREGVTNDWAVLEGRYLTGSKTDGYAFQTANYLAAKTGGPAATVKFTEGFTDTHPDNDTPQIKVREVPIEVILPPTSLTLSQHNMTITNGSDGETLVATGKDAPIVSYELESNRYLSAEGMLVSASQELLALRNELKDQNISTNLTFNFIILRNIIE